MFFIMMRWAERWTENNTMRMNEWMNEESKWWDCENRTEKVWIKLTWELRMKLNQEKIKAKTKRNNG